MTEPELILTHIRNCRRIDLYSDARPVTFEETEQWISILKRREKGEPLQYILGFTEFMGLRFEVDPRVLIPRPETELLVQAMLERTDGRPVQVLDLGTGSGNIAVSLAALGTNISLTALDISDDALDLARSNAKMNSVQEKIRFIRSDLFRQLTDATTFDMIVSNPPYISSMDMSSLEQQVLFEPPIALDGGTDGMDFYRRIFAAAPGYLKEGGLLFLEMGADQRQDLEQLVSCYADLEIEEVRKDLCQRDRILICKRKKR